MLFRVIVCVLVHLFDVSFTCVLYMYVIMCGCVDWCKHPSRHLPLSTEAGRSIHVKKETIGFNMATFEVLHMKTRSPVSESLKQFTSHSSISWFDFAVEIVFSPVHRQTTSRRCPLPTPTFGPFRPPRPRLPRPRLRKTSPPADRRLLETNPDRLPWGDCNT